MERGKYIQTRLGQKSELMKRRLRRFIFMLDQEPQSKNIRPADAVEFQKKLLAQMKSNKRRSYTGPVFLMLDFRTTSKTPPAIYKLPKNYLDLMETPCGKSGIRRKYLLYRNDRQVKALVVRYHLGNSSDQPEILVQSEPYRDFLADVELVERVCQNDFEDEAYWFFQSDLDEFRNGPFPSDDEGNSDLIRELFDIENEQESWVNSLGKDAYEAMLHLMRSEIQRDHLQRTDRFTCQSVLDIYGDQERTKNLSHNDIRSQLAEQTRNMSLKAPFTLELHHAPHRQGDSSTFKTVLRRELKKFKEQRPYLFPLSSLLSVTILMVPPKDGGKDLDNLARLILPQLHEIWAPPSHIAHTIKTENIKDDTLRQNWEEARANLPKQPKHSITEYRVFELPRSPNDLPEGFVRLTVGDGMTTIPFREEIKNFLDKWRDTL